MSFTTFFGFIAGTGIFVGAILLATDNLLLFFSASSLLLVLGGTLAATFVGQEARYVMLALKGIASTFAPQRVPQHPEPGSRPYHPLGLSGQGAGFSAA